jgi:hypothetical protein
MVKSFRAPPGDGGGFRLFYHWEHGILSPIGLTFEKTTNSTMTNPEFHSLRSRGFLFPGIGFLCAVGVLFLLLGCNEGSELTSPVSPVWSLSPTLASLTVSGNTISRAEGGILKLSCRWTNSEAVTSATAYLAFVEELNSPTLGPQGIISSDTTASSTVATTVKNLGIPYSLLWQTTTTATTTTATSSATTTATTTTTTTTASTTTTTTTTATSTTTVTASSSIWLPSSLFSNPLALPTGIATRDLSGVWSVEIPFPASAIANAPDGKQQMQLWMMINSKKTNTLAFEITFSS